MKRYDEKRQYPRVYQENSLTVVPMEPTKTGWSSKAVKILSKDISAGGIRLRLPDFLPINSVIKIEIRLEKPRQRLTSTAVIRWIQRVHHVNMYDAGVQFTDVSPEMRSALQEYCEQYAVV